MPLLDMSAFVLNARGPLANMPALDVMWVSFYSIGLMMLSVIMVSAVRKWVHNAFFSIALRFIAFAMFFIGTVLMVLVVATWPA
ncbi:MULTISPECIES: DUF2768 domain-containing protein [unclassified Lysinibacillus]|uniref:DUF2768 domain-containing protein n=1 Tax=unclassified Lysinibacillus TaxID=2636778 RepID=UPI0036E42583